MTFRRRQHMISTAAGTGHCPHCEAPVLLATDEGIPVKVNPEPIGLDAEAAVLLAGGWTYDGSPTGLMVHRDSYRRMCEPTGPIYADHNCKGANDGDAASDGRGSGREGPALRSAEGPESGRPDRDGAGAAKGERGAESAAPRNGVVGERVTAALFAQPSGRQSGGILADLYDILAAHQGGQGRSMQKSIGPSEIGNPCDRALAYRLAHVPPVNEEPLKWAPLVGTWGHDGLARALDETNKRLGRERYLVERRVQVSGDISGVTDLYDMDTDEVIDWKFVGKTRLATYKRKGPGATYRVQAHLYGRGWALAGFPVRSVRVVFLPRWSHLLTDGWEWAEPYDAVLAAKALVRLEGIKSRVGAGHHFNSFDGKPEETCRFCKWHRPATDGRTDETGCPGESEAAPMFVAPSFVDRLKAAGSVDELIAIWNEAYPAGAWTAELERVGLARQQELLASK